MNVVIIEDEVRARNLVKTILEENYPSVVIFEADNLEEGVLLIKEQDPDILYLDIKLPGESGLEISKYFQEGEIDFEIIFTTAYNEYAIEAFKTSAIDFLLKPIDPIEFIQSTNRVLKKIRSQNIKIQLQKLEQEMVNIHLNKIALEVPKGYLFVPYDEVIYFQADGMYTEVFLLKKPSQVISKPLVRFVEQLKDKPLFYRPHRSYLVNLKFIKEVKKTDGYYIILENGKLIPVSRENKHSFLEIINKHF